MENEVLDILNHIITKIDNMDAKIDIVESSLREEIKEVREEVKASETRTKIYIENDVSKKIEALFDGYKLTHEKQWELERVIEELKQRVELIENRLA